MTKYTEIECDCCGAMQTGIIDEMEYTWTELRRGPSLPSGFRPRHLCPDCTKHVYEFIEQIRNDLNITNSKKQKTA